MPKGTEEESKDPEDASVTMLCQGVLSRLPVLPSSAVRDGFNCKFWVYILVSRTGTLYIGVTGYFDRRLMQHKMDTIEGFTKKYKVHRLVYYETFGHALNAISREKQLKGWRREKKIATDRENKLALAGLGGTLGQGNAVPGTEPR